LGPPRSVSSTTAFGAGPIIRWALTQRAICSQLVDNLNASIHLRALLTDLFLIDEAIAAAGA
jgi:hypothetical protein